MRETAAWWTSTHTRVDNTSDDRSVGLPRKIQVLELRLHGECDFMQPIQQLMLLTAVYEIEWSI